MRHSLNLLICLATFLYNFWPEKSAAQEGGYAGAYLHAGVGVRAWGLGGAFVAVANDVTASHWNPAGLGQIHGPQFGAMYSLLTLDRQYNYAALAWPLGFLGTISASWTDYRVGDIEARDQTGAMTGKFSNDEMALLLAHGKQLTSEIAIGGSVKWLQHNLAGSRASGIGYDLGVLLKPINILTFGASAQNLQTSIAWNTAAKTRENFPRIARFGFNLKPLPIINLSADYEFFGRQIKKWHLGGEILLGGIAGLRAGSNNGALAMGASLITLASNNTIIEVDYGLMNDPIDHSLSHRIALLLKFRPSQLPRTIPNPIPEINPGDVVDKNEKYLLLLAQIVESRKNSLIVNIGKNHSLQKNMILKIYLPTVTNEMGKCYCAAAVTEVGNLESLLEIFKEYQPQTLKELSAGKKVMVKAFRQVESN